MSCNGCGSTPAMTKEQVENLLNEKLKSGDLQAGLTDCDGNSIAKGGGAVVLCSMLATKVNELIKDGTIDVVKDVQIKNGKLIVTDGQGKDTETELPFVTATNADKDVVFTLPDGTTVTVPKSGSALDDNSFDNTIKKGANEPDKFGVNLADKGGLDYDKTGAIGIKTGAGLTLDEDGNVSTDPATMTKDNLKSLLQAMKNNGLLGDGVDLDNQGRLKVKTVEIKDEGDVEVQFYTVDK